MKWFPISTYNTKSPVEVILAFPGGFVSHGIWDPDWIPGEGRWIIGCEGFSMNVEPWMWMPWPSPPEE